MAAVAAAVVVAAAVGERTDGALKSALRMSTFKTSGKRVFVSRSSGKRIPVSSGKRNNSNSDSILDGYYDRLISNLDGLKPSKIEARLVHNPSSRAPLKIVDGHRWSPGIYRALRLLGKTLNAAWEGAFI